MLEAPKQIYEPGQAEKQQEIALRAAPVTYYRYPAIKQPEWGWEVILYFFMGGIAAGSYLIATLADLFGTPRDRPVARTGRYLAVGAIATAPLLLIADLGRSERFANMFRIIKSRSPMSVGTWGLSGLGLFAILGVFRQAFEDGRIDPDSPAARLLAWVPLPVSGVLGSLLGFFVGGYTGVLLSFTNVPLWARNRLLQGPLFLSSALSTGLATTTLALAARGDISPDTQSWLKRTEDVTALGELGMIAGTFATLGPLSRPLTRRPYALPFWLGSVGLGIIAPLILRRGGSKTMGRGSRALNVAAGLSTLVGGLIFRWATVMAGRESVNDPSAYITFTGDRSNRRNSRARNWNSEMQQYKVQQDGRIHEARGIITLAQEDRFRLQTEDGHSLLLILDTGMKESIEDLESLAGSHRKVMVRYQGEPDAGAVALELIEDRMASTATGG